MTKLSLKLVTALMLFTLSPVSAALANDYPSRPIKLTVGFPPGGPTDIVGRVIGNNLARELGGTVIIENRGGAGGVVAAQAVAGSKPDGYTLLVSVEASHSRGQAFGSLPYDPIKDFTLLRKVAKQRILLVTHPSLPVSTAGELVAYMKARPGQLNFPGSFGTSGHVGGLLFDHFNGTKGTYISYPGGSALATDLMAGTVHYGFFTEAAIGPQVTAGKVKALAVVGPEKSPQFTNLPTIVESGAKAQDASPWFGVVGPAGLPADVTKKLTDALDRMVVSGEYIAQLANIGAVSVKGTTSEGLAKEANEEIAFWKKFIVDNKIEIQR